LEAAASSRLAHAEVRAALAAASRARRLTVRRFEAAVDQWEGVWLASQTIELSDPLVRRAGDHALTGADAVHLASAEALPEVVVATWDRRLGRAAATVGLGVVPAA
jgi:predicted nucleic acid-binding protein